MALRRDQEETIWIFGYGSLIWKPGFAFVDHQVGYIRDWSRRFYQGSIDHRGVPGAPGRVVTLLADPGALCWGRAFLAEDASVLSYLDHRERGGFDRLIEAFYTSNAKEEQFCQVYVYVANEDNPNYLGPAEVPEIAEQILRSTGPSGPNTEYLLRLAEGLRAIDVVDNHVFTLEQQVRALLS